MPATTNPWRTLADLRAERHAKTFTEHQLPPPDERVRRLLQDGYVPLQISSLLQMPMIDVRLQLARMTRDELKTEATTRESAPVPVRRAQCPSP